MGEVGLEVEVSGAELVWALEDCPGLGVDGHVPAHHVAKPELLATGGARGGGAGLCRVLLRQVQLQVGPPVQLRVAGGAGVGVVVATMPLQHELVLEGLGALVARPGELARVLRHVGPQQVVLVEGERAGGAGVLLQRVDPFYVLLEGVLVGKLRAALLTLHLLARRTLALVVHQHVPLQVGVPGERLVTGVAGEGALPGVGEEVGGEAGRSGEYLGAAWEGAGVAGGGGGEASKGQARGGA